MKRIYDIILKIRNRVNECGLYKNRFYKQPKNWNKLCSAMDTIEDTCESCLDFEKKGLGSNTGEKYLRLYGLLQSIFVQQDSIKVLHKVLLSKQLNDQSFKNWKIIRDLRNMTVGHPFSYDYGNKSVFLSRVTISNRGFQLVITENTQSNNSTRFININLVNHYKKYINESVDILNNTLNKTK